MEVRSYRGANFDSNHCSVIARLRVRISNVKQVALPRLCLHLNVVGEFASFCDPESYAGGSVAPGRATQAGQVKG
jgi:hypothetical protein